MIDSLYSQVTPTEEKEIPPRRDKYLPYRRILETNPELADKIKEVFSSIPYVPATHITSRAFRKEDSIIDSGFIQGIKESGFRSLDTNVGVFMVKAGKRQIATPQEFADHPEKFLRELETLIRHYYHHGTRTNKNILGDELYGYVGIPSMLLVDISECLLVAGSDYEDHYKLGSIIPGTAIVGEIDLENVGSVLIQELPRIATEFLNNTQNYYANKVRTS